ncbi:MAG: FHA domain-containing protein [Kiritimatiellia bacterium]
MKLRGMIMYRLIVEEPGGRKRGVSVQEGTVTLGRDPSCDIRIADDEVSWKHAIIEKGPGGISIRDLGSLNKITINGRDVREAHLASGDLIELGRTRIRFEDPRVLHRTTGRRTSVLHRITLISVAAVVVIEIGLVFATFIWRHRGGNELLAAAAPEAVQKPAAAAKPEAPEEPPKVEENIEVARAEVKEEPAPIPEEKPEPEPEPEPEPKPEPAPATSWEPVPDRLPEEEMEQAAEIKPVEKEDARPVIEKPEPVAEEPAKPVEKKEEPLPEPQPEPVKIPVIKETAAAKKPKPPETKAHDDPLTSLAQDMLREARTDIEKMNYKEAEERLERIEIVAPDFLPAYEERARLYEKRGMLQQAGEQWAELMKRAEGKPEYAEAAAERSRIAQRTAEPGVITVPRRIAAISKPERPLAGRIEIQSVEEDEFGPGPEFDEMRIFRIRLRPNASEKAIEGGDVSVSVNFYEKDSRTREIRPASAYVPGSIPMRKGIWSPGGFYEAQATYMQSRALEATEINSDYYGYVVQVFYEDVLQDEKIYPAGLRDNLSGD